jgi:6-pyruvoyltetrahydropterin/6-carboxytetrahydropterin synthase
MFELKVKDHIASAHTLKGYDGPCAHLHGHTWKVEVTLKGDRLNDIGLLIDFKIMKKKLKDVLMPLDHVNLNEHPAFTTINPSTENLAKYIYSQLTHQVAPLQLKSVEVFESDTASIIYYE